MCSRHNRIGDMETERPEKVSILYKLVAFVIDRFTFMLLLFCFCFLPSNIVLTDHVHFPTLG